MKDLRDLRTLSSVISRVFKGSCHDATLLVEGERIPVHKDILASWSNYFKELFKVEAGQSTGNSSTLDGVASNSRDIVEIKDVKVRNTYVYELGNVKAEVFRGILHYIYSGTYKFDEEIEMENHLKALELAHQYNLESLETKLAEHLVQFIDLDNFVDFCNLKTQIQNDQLEISCVDFLKNNADEIAKSDNFPKLTLDSLLLLLDDDNFATEEIDIFRALEKWVNVNTPNEETTNAIVKKIRLATISQKDLFNVVAASKDLPSIDILEPLRSIAQNDVASRNFRRPPEEARQNVAQSSLGAKLLTGSVHEADLISGSNGWTTHRVGGKPDCITVQLDKPYKINLLKFTLYTLGGGTYKYHIEVSVDGEEWRRIIDRSNVSCSTNQSLRFNPTVAKFIKLTGVNCTELTVSSLEAMYLTSECELIDGIPVATTNVALGSKEATATDENKDGHLCIDGNEETFSRLQGNQTLLITLSEPQWISSLRMLINSNGDNYTIESFSGESWQPVCDEVLGDKLKVWREFEFSRRVVAQFRIKLKIIQNTQTHGYYNNQVQQNNKQKNLYLHCFESPASTIPVTNE